MKKSRAWVAVALVAAVVTGCRLPGDDTGTSHGIGVENRTSRNVQVRFARGNEPEKVLVESLLALSGTALLRPESGVGPCNEGVLRAYSASGDLVDETSDRLCDGDTWVIEDHASAP